MKSDWGIDERFVLILPEVGDTKKVVPVEDNNEKLSMEQLRNLIYQIEYYKPTYTKIRISEEFLSLMVRLGHIEYSSDITRLGLRMEIDNSIDSYIFE